MATWKPFHFESNQFFDTISGPDDWERLRKAYPKMSDDELLNAKQATYNNTLSVEHREKHRNYGLRLEHDGVKRLKDFFEANDMLQFLACQDQKDAERYRWLREQAVLR